MTDYAAPLRDMRFILDHLVDLPGIAALPGYEEASDDIVDAILEEAGKLAGDVIGPLNRVGDRQGCRLENGVVRTPDGWREAYAAYRDGGWNAVPFAADWGGQGLPWALATPVQEMWQSANLAWGLCPLLNQGAVELLEAHGSPDQQQIYLPKLVSGDWTGTMNLTEPQAGSDLSQIRTRAVRRDDGSYAIEGQKIYITYGEHDLTDNIVHMVLARTPDAPAGVKGISLFIVPKFLPQADGTPGPRNDLRAVSLEEKLGIHASPTCVMAYGDNGGATGYLVGEEGRGIQYMFTMMNNARLGVGLQGVAVAERAYQQARAYAIDRVQSRPLDDPKGGPVAIIRHPDVRRMLLTMRALTEAARALTYVAFGALDRSKRAPNPTDRAAAQARVDLLTPIAKAWSTDIGCEVASLGVQIHGGMGFVEDMGAAQHYRDARITPIYEGTNGIQANDLVFRKVIRDEGAAMAALIADMRTLPPILAGDPDLAGLGDRLSAALADLDTATRHLAGLADNPTRAAAVAVPYLDLAGTVIGGWLLGRAAVAAGAGLGAAANGDGRFLAAKRRTARFYGDHILPRGTARLAAIVTGDDAALAFDEAAF